MINPEIPTEEINLIADKLATELFANWDSVKAEVATELQTTEQAIQDVLDQHRQHCLNLVYNKLKRGGHISY